MIGCASEIVSGKLDVLFEGSRHAGTLNIIAGKPAGWFVCMDKQYHCGNRPPGGNWGQQICCQYWLFDHNYIVKDTENPT